MAQGIQALAFRWFEEVWNQRRESAIPELMSPESVGRLEGLDGELSRDDFLAYHRAFLNAVPDLLVGIGSIIVDGPRAMIEWRLRGTHLGNGLGRDEVQALGRIDGTVLARHGSDLQARTRPSLGSL